MTDINSTASEQLDSNKLVAQSSKSVGEDRRNKAFSEIKDDPEAQRFETQGGFTEDEKETAQETLDDIEQARAERSIEKEKSRSISQSKTVER